MRKLIKRFTIIIVIIIALLGVCGVCANYFLGDKITSIVLNELNKRIEGEINVGAVDFTMVKRFPSASIEFKNVLAKSSKNINKSDFPFDADTFLIAQNVFLEFSLFDLIQQHYNIRTISVENARVNLLFDNRDENNFSFIKSNADTTSSDVNIDIQALSLSNIKLAIVRNQSRLVMHNYVREFSLSGSISGQSQQVVTEGDVMISMLKVENTVFIDKQNFEFDIEGNHQNGNLSLSKCSIKNLDHSLVTKGDVAMYDDSTRVDLTFVSNTWSFNHIKQYLPQNVTDITNKLHLSANFFCIGHINGTFAKDVAPAMSVEYNVEKADMRYENRPLSVSGSGLVSTKNMLKPNAYTITADNLKIYHRGSSAMGKISMSNFDAPRATGEFDVSIKLEDANDIFRFDSTKSIKALAIGKLKMSGAVPTSDKYTRANHSKLNFDGNLKIQNLSYKNVGANVSVSNCEAVVRFGKDDVKIEGLTGQCNSTNFEVSGVIKNCIPYSIFDNETLRPDLKIKCDNILTAEFMGSDTITTSPAEYSLPKDIVGNVEFISRSITHERLLIENIFAKMRIQKSKVLIDEFNCNTMNGEIGGNCVVNNISNGNFTVIGDWKLNNVNVKKLFYSFDNFEQEFITDKNLDGMITSKLLFQMAMDKHLELIDRTLFAEASTTIQNGQLIDFKPIEQLSSFIALDELQDISFSTLQNDFVIKDNTIYIPKMDINSSAFNITISGSQKLEGNFEYHLKLTLDEFLSKKRKNKKEEYFGEVQDDGLGHTKLFLKIVCENDELKFSYDKTEAKNVMKEKIQDEKREILDVFKNEFSKNKKTDAKPESPAKINSESEEFIFEFDE